MSICCKLFSVYSSYFPPFQFHLNVFFISFSFHFAIETQTKIVFFVFVIGQLNIFQCLNQLIFDLIDQPSKVLFFLQIQMKTIAKIYDFFLGFFPIFCGNCVVISKDDFTWKSTFSVHRTIFQKRKKKYKENKTWIKQSAFYSNLKWSHVWLSTWFLFIFSLSLSCLNVI